MGPIGNDIPDISERGCAACVLSFVGIVFAGGVIFGASIYHLLIK